MAAAVTFGMLFFRPGSRLGRGGMAAAMALRLFFRFCRGRLALRIGAVATGMFFTLVLAHGLLISG
jgi:hypothetical protein